MASFLFVLASITGFCVETLPSIHSDHTNTEDVHDTLKQRCGDTLTAHEARMYYRSNPDLERLDRICTAFFTTELIVRIVFAPNKKEFFKSIMNIIDILALLPLYVQVILDITQSLSCLKTKPEVVEIIFILRIIRIFRIFHMVKHYKALKILVHAIKASVQELLMLAIFLFIAMLVFSTFIFYAERRDYSGNNATSSELISDIPLELWWSIITMTTVGYGDVHPTSPLGYVVGGLCAVCGVLLVALTIPVISNNFTLFYIHARTREQIVMKDMTAKECLAQARSTVK